MHRELQWLKVPEGVTYKVSIMVYHFWDSHFSLYFMLFIILPRFFHWLH